MWVRGNVGNSGRVGRVAGGGRGAAEIRILNQKI